MTFTASWVCSQVLEPAWELRGAGWNGWNVQVDGDAPVDVDIRFKIPEGRMGEMTPGYTANRPVNAIPYVCAAAPGIRTTVDLPQIIPALGN
jgi:4-hydroxy-tetrahydrodipicolinate reductase